MRPCHRLCLVPLIFALAIAAGCGKSDDKKAATQVAAKVNSDEITVHQINNVLARAPNVTPEVAQRAKREILDKLIDQQSAEANTEKRKQLVWQIERRLAEEGARPIIYYPRGGTCTQPYVKGLTTMVNSIYNGYRMEDVWLDK